MVVVLDEQEEGEVVAEEGFVGGCHHNHHTEGFDVEALVDRRSVVAAAAAVAAAVAVAAVVAAAVDVAKIVEMRSIVVIEP